MRKIDLIVLHCSASDYENQTADWIRKIHVEQNGWDDIGYHFFIRKDGLIERGRPLSIPGAHVKGWNKWSIGICLAGDQDFTKLQFGALKLLLLLLRRDPDIAKAKLLGHCDLDSKKTCPNFNISAFQQLWNAVQI